MMQVLQHLLYHIFIILIQSYTFSGWVRSVRSESAHMGCLKENQKCFVLQFGGLFLVFNFLCWWVRLKRLCICTSSHQSLWAISTHTDNQSLIKWMLLAAVAVSSHAVGLETNAFMLPPPSHKWWIKLHTFRLLWLQWSIGLLMLLP